jgi:putative oxygen-independent coproporphyrinogen III oxidase
MACRTAPAPLPSSAPPALTEAPRALYVHWPFCVAKCPYCDFNSHVRASIDEDRWRTALLAELDHWADSLDPKPLGSIFFGGGTPSLMAPATAAAVITRAADKFGLERDVEITLEANPSSAEAKKFHALASAGVNRLSLGLQALDDDALAALGRPHDARAGLAALDAAQAAVPRVSIDLIYARPGQSLDDWRAELGRALDFGTEHLSLYQLSVEPGTAFATLHARGDLVLPNEDLAADLFALTQEMTSAAGRPAYEISNHAQGGAESRHNLVYWRGGTYLGIGPGAHGRLLDGQGWQASQAERLPERWLKAVEARGHGTAALQAIAPSTRAREMLLMGLRLTEGVDLGLIARASNAPLDAVIDAAAVDELRRLGLIAKSGARLALTRAGRPVLNAVLARLLN